MQAVQTRRVIHKAILRRRKSSQKGDFAFLRIRQCNKNWNVNESIFTLRANKDKIYPSILYNLLLSKDFQDYSISHAQGSVQKGVRILDLKEYEIALPKIEDQKNINLALSYLLDKLKINQNQNKYLLQIRDSLLPKLMSGDIRVK